MARFVLAFSILFSFPVASANFFAAAKSNAAPCEMRPGEARAIAAGVVAWAQKVFVTRERLSSWLPPLFLHALEVTVLCINYYNDTKRGNFVGFARLFEDEFGDGGVGRGDARRGDDGGDDGASVSDARVSPPGYGAGGSGNDTAFEGMEQAQKRRGGGSTSFL